VFSTATQQVRGGGLTAAPPASPRAAPPLECRLLLMRLGEAGTVVAADRADGVGVGTWVGGALSGRSGEERVRRSPGGTPRLSHRLSRRGAGGWVMGEGVVRLGGVSFLKEEACWTV